jgi:hypothetical protein
MHFGIAVRRNPKEPHTIAACVELALACVFATWPISVRWLTSTFDPGSSVLLRNVRIRVVAGTQSQLPLDAASPMSPVPFGAVALDHPPFPIWRDQSHRHPASSFRR